MFNTNFPIWMNYRTCLHLVKIDAGRTIGLLNILGEIAFFLTLNCVLFCETN
jgi:hypothetical protein